MITRNEIESLRDLTFHRTPQLRITSIAAALEFINQVGFCYAFSARNSELPCLWHAACGERQPQYPVHTHEDPNIGLVWEAKDILAENKAIYYGKAIKRHPSMISLELFSSFYVLRRGNQNSDAYLTAYLRGELSPDAKRIYEALLEQSPMVTSELKLASNLAHPAKRTAFDRAMAELQMNFYLVKIAEFYDPFSFLWDLVEERFSQEIAQSRGLDPATARTRILRQYFSNVQVATPIQIQRLLDWSRPDIMSTLDALQKEGFISDRIRIENEKHAFWGLTFLKTESC